MLRFKAVTSFTAMLFILFVKTTIGIPDIAASVVTSNDTNWLMTANEGSTSTIGPPSSSSTIAPELACQYFNNSCEECVKHTKCYYCYSTSQCLFYQFSSGFPSSKDCNWEEVRWAVCWFNFKALIISLGCMAGVLLISLLVCMYCCCRRKKKVSKFAHEAARREREREERRIKAEERKTERKLRNDEIRRKYGLMKEDQPYQRFDA